MFFTYFTINRLYVFALTLNYYLLNKRGSSLLLGELLFEGKWVYIKISRRELLKKYFILLALIVLTIAGYSYSKTEGVTNKGLKISNFQLGIGSVGDTETFDKQRLRYDITISNAEKTELKRESVEIVLTLSLIHI